MFAASSCILLAYLFTTHGRSVLIIVFRCFMSLFRVRHSPLGAKQVLFIRKQQVRTKSNIGKVPVR